MLIYIVWCVTLFVSVNSYPQEELDSIFEDILKTASDQIPSRITIADYDYHLPYDLYGVKYNLKLRTYDTVITGLNRLTKKGKVVASVVDQSSKDGLSPLLEGWVSFGTIDLSFPMLEVSALGYSFNGTAGLSIVNAEASLSVKVYRDMLVKCFVVVSLTKPEGHFVVHTGDSELMKLAYTYAEYSLSEFYPYKLLLSTIFPDVTTIIEKNIRKAVKNVMC